MNEHDTHDPHHVVNDHERTDADVGRIVKAGIGLVVLVLATGAGLRWCYVELQKRDPVAEEPVTGDPHERLPPAPRLQTVAARDMAEFRREQDSQLASYGWADEKHMLARVPIDAAIKHVAEKGLPTWPAAKNEERKP